MAKKTKKVAPIGEVARASVLAFYASCQNYNATARQFGIHPEQVKRMWKGARESEKRLYIDKADDAATVVSEAVARNDTEWAIQQRSKMREVFEKSTDEMLTRLMYDKHKIKDKDLLQIIKSSYAIAENKPLVEEKTDDDAPKVSATHQFFQQIEQNNITVITERDEQQ